MLTSQAVAQKWQRNTSAAAESLKAGVMAVTTAPTARAAQAVDRYLAGVNAAVASGRMQQALQAVSLQDWQQAMITKGQPRIASGVAAAIGKVQTFMDRWLPYEQALSDRVAAMPKGTLADAQARAAFAIEYNSKFKGQG